MNWADLRSPQIDALDREMVVVIPLGSIEQHGAHLPLVTDTLLVSELADRVEEELRREILVLPTLWLGASAHHSDFAGTLSLSGRLYSQVITELARSVLRAGFRRLFFLCGHGGNEVPTQQALADLAAESEEADSALLAAACYWRLADAALRPEQHGLRQTALSHACEFETSMVLSLEPGLVSMRDAGAPPPAFLSRWWNSETGGPVHVFRRFRRLTAGGAMGLPLEATPAKGSSLLEAATSELVAFLRDYARLPRL